MNVSRRTSTLVVVAAIAAGGATWFTWQKQLSGRIPDGIVSANGRIEATEVDIANKFAGRVASISAQEGDLINVGTTVAQLDTAEIEAQLRQSQAEAERARQALVASQAAVATRRSELILAEKQLERALTLATKGFATHERHDIEEQRLASAKAAVDAAHAQVAEAKSAIAAAEASVDHMKSILDDANIKSPIRGRVQYRLVEPGTVLPAGGRIVTILDLTDVTMTIFLPANEAGRLVIGDEARVVLDAAPDYVFPVKVAFVSSEAQFTPKTVETAAEREKLMFRVKLQAPQDLLKKFENRVMSGLRGVAYVRTDSSAKWPQQLSVKLPEQ